MKRCGSVCPTAGPALTCALERGHEGRCKAGYFAWWAPPRVFVGGEPYAPDPRPVRFSWERPEEIELDQAAPSREEIIGAFQQHVRPLPDEDLVDVDVEDNVF